jgi:hypothetical protein
VSKQRNKRDAALYREYGRTMKAAQSFEYAVRQLVFLMKPLEDDEDRTTAELDAEITRFFKRPLAKLARQLDVDDDFAEELRAAVSTRNTLAHEYFMTTFLEINVGLATHKELIATLKDARSRYEAVNRRLDALVDDRHAALGIDVTGVLTTEAEMRRAMLGD